MTDGANTSTGGGPKADGLYFQDIEIGASLPELSKGPMSVAHIVRWSAATENWHRIHYDRKYAVEHDELPDVVVNGSWKQHVLLQLLTDWVDESGWVYRLKFRFLDMNLPGDVFAAWGKVTEKRMSGQFGLVTLEVGLRNQLDLENTAGTATVVLPRRGGPSLPYPFDPRYLEEDWDGSIVA